MNIPILKIGNYEVVAWGIKGSSGGKFFVEEHRSAAEYRERGFGIYAPRGANLKTKSTPYFPDFTFPIEVNNNIPLFMQITRDGIVYTRGIFFALNGFGETFTNVHVIRKIDDKYEVEILYYHKIPVERTSGVWITDGRYLWEKGLGENFSEAAPEKYVDRISQFDIATIYEGRTYGRMGNDLIILDHWTGKETVLKNVFKKVPVKSPSGTYFVPQYLLDNLLWGSDEW